MSMDEYPVYPGFTHEMTCDCAVPVLGRTQMRPGIWVLCCMTCGSSRLLENKGTGLGHEERIRVLEEALAPFAKYAEQMAERWGSNGGQGWGYRDDSAYYGTKNGHNVTYGDWRRAAKAMKK